MVDLTPSSVDPTLFFKSEVDQVVDPTPSSVDYTLPLKSKVKVVNSTPSSVDPTLPLQSEVNISPFPWNHLQVLIPFPLIGIDSQDLAFLPTRLSK
jgi:hypothetical protein